MKKVLIALALASTASAQTYTISTFAGGGPPGVPVNVPGTSASLGPNTPQCLAADRAGNVFFAFENAVLRLDGATGILTLAAGNGTAGFSGDAGPATSAQLNSPAGLAVDSAGNLYIADSGNYRIRKVSAGVISTVAGNGTPGFSGDNGSATSAQLDPGSGVAVDSAGSLYVAEYHNQRVRKVSGGVITTLAGNGTPGFSGDNGPATSAQLLYPAGVAADSAGVLYIADCLNQRIRKVSNGVITTVVGDGTSWFGGDNGPAAKAELWYPNGLAVDSAGNLYIADTYNHRIRKVSNGVIATVAGGGPSIGDNGPAASAQLLYPYGVAVDSAGNLYITDYGHNRIRKVSGGVIATVAGNGTSSFSGDNGPATSAELNSPQGVAVDPAGAGYIADTANNRIRKVSGGVIATVAGGGLSFGDDVPATSAGLDFPRGVAVDTADNLYIADTMNGLIREVSNGVITTVAGNGTCCFSGDNGPATSAQLYFPDGVAVDSAGNLYIADTYNNRIRKVSGGVIATAAGTGTPGFSGDNGPAASAQLLAPSGIAVDASGNVYFTDANRIRKISNGVITTVAGNGTQGFNGDNIPATSAQLEIPRGIAVDSAGSLYIAETNRIRKVSSGVIATVAGNGTWGFSGDNGPAANAQVFGSPSVAVDSAGSVYVADSGNNRVRLLTPLPAVKSVVNAASYISGPVSPGELVTIFGTGIGPVTAAGVTTDQATGRLATNIGGVQVLFNGTPAPMIYASGTQVSAVVPYEMASVANPSVWINFAGQTSNAYRLSVTAAAPGLFAQNASGSGPGSILNQDNSLNGPGHAAAKGSIVQVYMTGEGQTTPQGVTGKITTATLPPPQVTPAPVQPISVLIGGQPANYAYAGEAPGFVAGLMQLNVQIPANAPSGALPIQMSIGGNMSQSGITMEVQ